MRALVLSALLCWTVAASAQEMSVQPLPISSVRLLSGPFQTAQKVNGEYLLSLEEDRLLAWFRRNRGLSQVAEPYGGWEQKGIAGHSLGHYLSALAWHAASTGSQEHLTRLKTVVAKLAECQSEDGAMDAIPDSAKVWEELRQGNIRSKGFDLNGIWVPFYTQHKILAGLIDAYQLSGVSQALTVAKKHADWIDDLTKKWTPADWQEALACEHGGMNESLYRLYEITKNEKYLNLGNHFYHESVLDPLRQKVDRLTGLHSNTQIPKVIGLAKRFELLGDQGDADASRFFWEAVAAQRSYANGGNSDHEHLSAPGELADHLSPATSETCNTYNLLKLTEHLFSWQPDSKLMDFAEGALFNHILASQDGQPGHFTYFVPLSSQAERPYSKPFDDFWCCVGTGMENHTRYGSMVYAEEGSTLFISQFISSALTWEMGGLKLELQTQFPLAEEAKVVIQQAPTESRTLKIRKPSWIAGSMDFKLNGKKVEVQSLDNGYVALDRVWSEGDTLSWKLPMNVYPVALPDKPSKVAFKVGPVLLAAATTDSSYDPCFVADADPAKQFKPIKGRPLTYSVSGAKPESLEFRPFWSFTSGRHSTYFEILTSSQWVEMEKKVKLEAAERREIEERTIDLLRVGEMQPERDHNLTGDRTESGDFGGRKYRHALQGGSFSFDLKVDPIAGNELRMTLWGGDSGRSMSLIIDGVEVFSLKTGPRENKFYEVTVPIPSTLTKSKSSVRIEVRASNDALTPGLYGCRSVRSGRDNPVSRE